MRYPLLRDIQLTPIHHDSTVMTLIEDPFFWGFLVICCLSLFYLVILERSNAHS